MKQLPIKQGKNMSKQYTCHLASPSMLSIELKKDERGQRPKMTSIDQALNLSPPISLRQMRLLTKKPRVKNPTPMRPTALMNPPIGYRPIAARLLAPIPIVMVLSDILMGHTTWPIPEAMRKNMEQLEDSIPVRVVRTPSANTMIQTSSSLFFWQVLLSPTNSRAFSMDSSVEIGVTLKRWLCMFQSQMYRFEFMLIIKLMAEEFNEEEEMIINQQYKIWKKESPDYYDFLLLHSLDWPSYTFQWLPQIDHHDTHTSFHALISSSNSDPEQCQLMQVKVDYPNDNKSEVYHQLQGHKITVTNKIQHSGQINRVRYCPANPSIMAVATGKGEITLTTMKENIGKLVGHTADGYGLNWNTVNKNLLLSGFSDKRICIWDIEQNRQENGKYLPIFQILHHSAPIQDVAWHRFHPSLFASCSDDRLISIWDTRFRNAGTSDDKKPIFEVVAHTDEIYSLDFSPFNEFLFASGSADENVSVWDMRNLTRALATLPTDKNAVIKVQWSPFTSSILASCGYGRNVDIWDLTKEKKEQDHPYLFRHMGHRSRVLDLDWHPTEKLLIGSVEENNCMQVWQVNRSLYYEQEEGK